MLPASSVGALAVFFGAIPRLLGFVLVLAAGWYLSALVARAVAALLRRTPVNRSSLLERAGITAEPAEVLAFIARWAMRLLAALVAFDVLGVPAVSQVLRQVVAWLPQLAAALIVVVLGGFLAEAAGRAVRGATTSFRSPQFLAAIARVSVWVFALLAAASQIGVGDELVNTLFIGAVAVVVLAGGLALGLGGQEIAARLVEKWYRQGSRTLGSLADAAQEAAVQASEREARREFDSDVLARRWRRMAPERGGGGGSAHGGRGARRDAARRGARGSVRHRAISHTDLAKEMAMAKTVVGLMQSPALAERLAQDLQSTCGCERSQIGFTAVSAGSTGTHGRSGLDEQTQTLVGGGAALGALLGLIMALVPLIDLHPLAAALAGAVIGALAGGVLRFLSVESAGDAARQEGSHTLVTVRAPGERAADCAAEVMRAHGAIDIEQRGPAQPQGRMEEQQVLPIAQEELAVGKREVSKGGLRVSTRVASVPAEQTVQLREEHATIERRGVDRPALAGEQLFSEQVFEVLEMAEEAVVQKRSRVKEEVLIAKHATQRTETVRDTVRKTEVAVERSYAGAERRRHNGPYSGQERRLALR